MSKLNDHVFPSCPPPEYFIGLDLGQARDFTAIAVLEHKPMPVGRSLVTYQYEIRTRRALLHLERLPLGLEYPAVVEHVSRLVMRPELGRAATLVVDATGVGRPVVDLLRRAALPCRLLPVTITSGGHDSRQSTGYYTVPKHDLIAGLLILFQRRELAICGRLKETKTLLHELGNMRVKISAQGRETYGVWQNGEHDDLVLAVALACWRGLRLKPPL